MLVSKLGVLQLLKIIQAKTQRTWENSKREREGGKQLALFNPPIQDTITTPDLLDTDAAIS